MSFNLSEYVNLRIVVILLGIVLFSVGMLVAWHQLGIGTKLLLAFGAIAFAVGLRYNAIYNVGVQAEQKVAGAFGSQNISRKS